MDDDVELPSGVPGPGRRGRFVCAAGILLVVGALAGCSLLRTRVPRFDRDAWSFGIDGDGDCLDTRSELLVRESLEEATWLRHADGRCEVIHGRWIDRYTGAVYTDPRVLVVDHLVPLEEAHASGGWAWDPDRKRAFANDLDQPNRLVLTHRSVHLRKDSRDPSEWRPSAPSTPPDPRASGERERWVAPEPPQGPTPWWSSMEERRCWYAGTWRDIKVEWDLDMDPAELRALRHMRHGCR